MDRKQFLTRTAQMAAGALLTAPLLGRDHHGLFDEERPGPAPLLPDPALLFEQVKLPYAFDALEPSIDKMTMEIHYTKHHAGYVKNIAAAIDEEKITASSEEDLFANMSKYSAKARNNAGGAWNHNFFWLAMRPAGGGPPPGKVTDALGAAFGSLDAFKAQFNNAAMKRFGSGWAWLVQKDGRLSIGSTANQDNPLMDLSDLRGTPLLALDVWEHAYYLKYQNKRDEYVNNWWNVVDWDRMAARMG